MNTQNEAIDTSGASGGNPELAQEKEVDLSEFLSVLWHRKFLILCISLLPTLGGYLFMRSFPRTYSLSYYYRSPISGEQLLFLKEYFWTTPNIKRLCQTLRENTFIDFADNLEKSSPIARKKVEFNLKAFTQTNGDVKTSAKYLQVILYSKDPQDLPEIGVFIQENITGFLVLDTFYKTISEEMQSLQAELTGLKEKHYLLPYLLDQKKSVLERLKAIPEEDLPTSAAPAPLQFHVYDNPEYLPLPYLIQAADVKVIELEEQIRYAEKINRLDLKINQLYGTLLDCIEEAKYDPSSIRLSDCIRQFQQNQPNEEMQGVAASLQLTLERLGKQYRPIPENPSIKGERQKTRLLSGILFANFFLLSIIIAFFLEKQRNRH